MLFYNTGLMVVNLVILSLYHRIMHITHWRRQVEVLGFLVLTGILVHFGVNFRTCGPLVGFWDKPVPASCPPELPFVYING